MSVANQNIVKIAPREAWNSEHTFARMHMDALQIAMNKLKGESFKLWVYINKNADGYTFDLSQKACAEWGIKKDAYYTARVKLIESEYLVPQSEGSNVLLFYEVPISEIQKDFSEKPKSIIISEKPKDSEIPKSFSEKPKDFSEIQKENSEKPKNFSEKPQRNTTYTTYTTQTTNTTNLNLSEKPKDSEKPNMEYPECTWAQVAQSLNGYDVLEDGLVRIRDTGKIMRIKDKISVKDF